MNHKYSYKKLTKRSSKSLHKLRQKLDCDYFRALFHSPKTDWTFIKQIRDAVSKVDAILFVRTGE
jgi:hypothetical protein